MASPRILCLGEILYDCLADQLGRALNEVESWTPYPGGAPANVACASVKLGTPSAFIGCVGQDQPGSELVNLLATIGVDTSGVQRHSTAPTRQVYVTRSLRGERHFAGFGERLTSDFADTRLQADKLPESLFIDADYLVIGTLELAYADSQQAIYRALELAKQYNVKVLIDINWRPVFWLDLGLASPLIKNVLRQADFIKCSDEEALGLFETEVPLEIAQIFPQTKGVLVTAGGKGCAYNLGSNIGNLAAFPVNVTDTTGAGDSFVAGFLHQCCERGDRVWQDADMASHAIIYANAVGALTTTKPGAIASQPTAQEVEAFLRETANNH